MHSVTCLDGVTHQPQAPITDKERLWDVMMIDYAELRKPMTQEQLNLLAECTALTKGLARRGYEIDKSFDIIISSLGFVYDQTPWQARTPLSPPPSYLPISSSSSSSTTSTLATNVFVPTQEANYLSIMQRSISLIRHCPMRY
jgi:hypothetical protein